MDAFVRRAMSLSGQKPVKKVTETVNWRCPSCDYIYISEFGDPEGGISPGTPFEDIPDSWKCPECGVSKSAFEKIGS
jgi:rubredoxin